MRSEPDLSGGCGSYILFGPDAGESGLVVVESSSLCEHSRPLGPQHRLRHARECLIRVRKRCALSRGQVVWKRFDSKVTAENDRKVLKGMQM